MPFDELIQNKKVSQPAPRHVEAIRRAENPHGKKLDKGSRSMSSSSMSLLLSLLKILIALLVAGVVITAAWWGYQLYAGE